MHIAVTGHRPHRLGGYNNHKLHQKIKDTINNELFLLTAHYNLSSVCTGMAIGFDQLVAEVCIDLQLPFIACLPFKGQERKWPQKVQNHYNKLLKNALKIVYVDEIPGYSMGQPGVYHPRKMIIRDHYMVDQTIPDVDGNRTMLSCWDFGKQGGTYQTIQYFFKKFPYNVVTNIIPDEKTIISKLYKASVVPQTGRRDSDVPF